MAKGVFVSHTTLAFRPKPGELRLQTPSLLMRHISPRPSCVPPPRPSRPPSSHQHPVHHAANQVGAGDLTDGWMRRAWRGEWRPCSSISRQCANTAASRTQNRTCLCMAVPASIPSSIITGDSLGHPVLGQSLDYLGIGLCLKSTQYVVPRVANAPAGPAGMGSRPVALYSSLSDSAR